MNTLNINGTVDESMNNQKDYRFVNADFEGSIAIPIQMLTTQGLKQISESFTNFITNTKQTGSNLMDLGNKGVDWVGNQYNDFKEWINPPQRPMSLAGNFSIRGLGALPKPYGNNSVQDYLNWGIYHEGYRFDDGSVYGFFPGGAKYETDRLGDYIVPEGSMNYNDEMMREVIKEVKPGNYNPKSNNCQDYCDKLRDRYNEKVKENFYRVMV